MKRNPSRYAEYEYDAEIDRAFTPGGNAYWVLRITWRREGSRTWNSFLLIPEDTDSFALAANKIGPAIDAYAHRGGSLEVTTAQGTA